MVEKLCKSILGVIFPPILMLIEKGCGSEFWINLILTFLFFIPGVFHAFYVLKVDNCLNIASIFISPLAVYLFKKSCDGDVCVNLVLYILLGFPGAIHAYYLMLDENTADLNANK